MAIDLNTYHRRCVDEAKQHRDELRAKKLTEMSDTELAMWLRRMEVAVSRLLIIVTLYELAADLADVVAEHAKERP